MTTRRRKITAIEIQTVPDLVAALRVRKAELGLSMTKIDALAGFQFGYAGKIFSREGTKAHRTLTEFSLPRILEALESRLVLVPIDQKSVVLDSMRAPTPHHSEEIEITVEKGVDAEKNMLDAYAERRSNGGINCWKPIGKKRRSYIMRQLANLRWEATKPSRKKRARSEAARKAARARWKKARTAQQ